MFKRMIQFILQLLGFTVKTEKQKALEAKKEKLEEKLREIEYEDTNLDDAINRFNE